MSASESGREDPASDASGMWAPPVVPGAHPARLGGWPPTRMGYMRAPVSSGRRAPSRVVWCWNRSHPIGAAGVGCPCPLAGRRPTWPPYMSLVGPSRRTRATMRRLGQGCGSCRTRYFSPRQAQYMSAAGPGSRKSGIPAEHPSLRGLGDSEGDQIRFMADIPRTHEGRSAGGSVVAARGHRPSRRGAAVAWVVQRTSRMAADMGPLYERCGPGRPRGPVPAERPCGHRSAAGARTPQEAFREPRDTGPLYDR